MPYFDMPYFDHEEEQFVYLMRSAWDLSQLWVTLAVQWPPKGESFIAIRMARGPLCMRAALRGEQWIFTWGHGRSRWVAAYEVDAVTRVWEVAR